MTESRGVISLITQALQAAQCTDGVTAVQSLAGGCMHRVFAATLESGERVVAKIGTRGDLPIFAAEQAGLEALRATETVLAPDPRGVLIIGDVAVALIGYIEAGTVDQHAWRRFGEELAKLHRKEGGRRYGFDADNYIGVTAQPNSWCDDWVRFNQEHRIGHQLRLAQQAGLLHAEETRRVEALLASLDQHLPARPHPALLHGDLWSGNVLKAASGRIAVIDPACYVGDGWADIAMMQLFGGFPAACFDAYRANIDEQGNLSERLTVYQLYHMLNHVNLFGRSYAEPVSRLLRELGY